MQCLVKRTTRHRLPEAAGATGHHTQVRSWPSPLGKGSSGRAEPGATGFVAVLALELACLLCPQPVEASGALPSWDHLLLA